MNVLRARFCPPWSQSAMAGHANAVPFCRGEER
jgi:hypothetical protein